MTAKEKELTEKLLFRELSHEEFIKMYPINLTEDKNHVFLSVKDAYDNKDNWYLELSLCLIVFNPSICFEKRFIDLLCLLLKSHWHKQHENIVMMLTDIRSPDTVDILYETAITKFDYLDYDDSMPLTIKCIHALGSINTDNAIQKLKILAESGNPIIKEKVKKQLSNYKG